MNKERQTGDELMRFQVPRGTEQKQAEEERPEQKTDTEHGAGDGDGEVSGNGAATEVPWRFTMVVTLRMRLVYCT